MHGDELQGLLLEAFKMAGDVLKSYVKARINREIEQNLYFMFFSFMASGRARPFLRKMASVGP